MQQSAPPPLPKRKTAAMSRRSKLLLAVALIPAFGVGFLIVTRFCGLLIPFSVPTSGMHPAVSAGDHIVMEGITFLVRPPRRGEVVVFRTDGLASVPPGTRNIKRIAGEPGDHVRIAQGRLYINSKPVSLSNDAGAIVFDLPRNVPLSVRSGVTVPDGQYIVLGDNASRSLDSRFFGTVPRDNIEGRVSICYWPPHRTGRVK